MLPLRNAAVTNSILDSKLEKEKLIPGEIRDVDVLQSRLLAQTTDPTPNILFELICQMLKMKVLVFKKKCYISILLRSG